MALFHCEREETQVKARIALWDNLKFVLILLVVVGHFSGFFQNESNAYRSIFLFIYTFHMPLFLFISGLFHKDEKISQKCLFYISVGFFQKIVFFITNLAIGEKPKFVLLGDNGIPWFMFVLAIYTAITYLLREQNKVYVFVLTIILACFVGYDTSIGDYLYLSRAIIFFPFYLFGVIINKEDIQRIKEKHKILLLVSSLIIILWLYICIAKLNIFYEMEPLFTGRNPFTQDMYYIGPFARIICYGITFLTGSAGIFLVPSRKIKCISSMGGRSIDVYFWHWVVYLLLERFLHIKRIFFWGPQGKVLFLLIAVAVTIVLSLGGIISYPLNFVKKCCYKK